MPGPRIVVIGAGPTGLGAAHRLRLLGHDDWVVLEASGRVGGLATSYTDEAGFTWDVGGHVLFSRYDEYNAVVDAILGDDCATVRREAWIWMEQRFVPYPFQRNVAGLDPQTVYDCVAGAVAASHGDGAPASASFEDWVLATMGRGIAQHFMLPYNFKVWATPPQLMSCGWIAERVARLDLDALLRNVILGESDKDWGPNRTFRYPLRGGTGAIWEGMRPWLQGRLELGCAVVSVDPARRLVRAGDGRTFPYDLLLSTMPVNRLVALTEGVPASVRRAAGELVWTGGHIVGVGVDRPAETDRCWVYFPEPEVPFYRVTYLSNYSPFLTPAADQCSLLTETSASPFKPEDPSTIVDRAVDGLVSAGLLWPSDRGRIVSRWHLAPAMTYPVPTLGRDAALAAIQPWLRAHNIWSRGRFGAWRYEIGNMDHAFMQGVEFVDAVLCGVPERTWSSAGSTGSRTAG